MTRDNRQILVNPHSSQEKVPVGALNLGEIAVQHNNVEDAALYVETVADSESANTIAKFITEKAIDSKIEDAIDIVQMEIDGINEAVGLPHDPEMWDSGLTLWDAIEQTYEEMTAGTAAATTKLEIDGDDEKYLALRSVKDDESSAVTYYIKTEGIDERVESAYTITEAEIESLNDQVEELSGATQEIEEALEELEELVEKNEVTSDDNTIIIEANSAKTDLSVHIDNTTIVKDNNGVLSADLEVVALDSTEIAALQDANVKEAYKLIYATDENRAAIGDIVKIYKDSSLYNVYLGHVDDELVSEDDPTVVPGSGDTALCLIYETANGTYELVAIDVNDFLEESEFADGLQVVNHVVSVKVDEASEEVATGSTSADTVPVLSVSEDGVKINHIQDAINYTISLLNADEAGSDEHVQVEVEQEGGLVSSVIVTTSDIASEEELNTVEEAVGLAADGSYIKKSGTNYLDDATSVEGEIDAIDKALKAISQKLSAAEVVEGQSVENWVTLGVSDDNSGTTAVTINDSALAEELLEIHSAITAEEAAREAADDLLRGTEAESTSAETSLWGIKKLISNITTTLVKDVTVSTGETLIDVEKEDTPEGDLYTVSSTERLNNAVELAESSVQEVAFAAVAEKNETVYGSNAGAEIVPADSGEGSLLKLDLSTIKIDCGLY